MQLALLIASIVASAIGTVPGIPAGLTVAINAITATLGVILKNGLGTSAPTTVSVVLATLQGVVAELRTVPGLNQSALTDIAVLEDALAAALAQHTATKSVDPAQLLPILPVA